jgi:undecaprenyl-diphosphatase
MLLWEAALLGLIQGLTEFLPVSSSGHLLLAQHLLGIDGGSDVTFEIVVHFGTALSIIVVYRNRLAELLRDSTAALANPTSISSAYRENPRVRTAVNIFLTLIPTGLLYLSLGDYLEQTFGNLRFVSAMLILTGVLLLLTMIRKNPSGTIGPGKALLIGAAQAAALFPGLSRSGSTICTAIYANTDPEEAANFSFLMLLPVVLIATVIKFGELLANDTPPSSWSTLGVGALVAFLSGIVAIKAILGVARRGRLAYFAIYCFALGGLGLWLL